MLEKMMRTPARTAPPRQHTARSGLGITPTCTLCTDSEPRTFKTEKSLRAHHNKYHAEAGSLVFDRSLGQLTDAAAVQSMVTRPPADDTSVNTNVLLPNTVAIDDPEIHAIVEDDDNDSTAPLQNAASGFNPVLANPLMQLTPQDFQSCRITSTGRISIIDAIMYIRSCSREAAKKVWHDIYRQLRAHRSGTSSDTTGLPLKFHQFTGARQRKTPVATVSMLLHILSRVPGPAGASLRSAQAELAARAHAGDLRLIADIVNVRDARLGTNTLATITTAEKDIVVGQLEAAHIACATQHAGSERFRAPEESCMASTVVKCPRTRNIIVKSKYLVKTGLLDRLWDATVDAVQGPAVLGDCRNVFFIRHVNTRMVKVGFSRYPQARMKHLQCGNAGALSIGYMVPTRRYGELKRWIHEYLDELGLHVRGEWFSLEEDADYFEVVERACAHGSNRQ
jgi:hypothetical protein